MTRNVASLLALLVVCACTREERGRRAGEPQSTNEVVAAAEAAAAQRRASRVREIPEPVAAPPQQQGLGPRLAAEAATRPAGAVTPDDVARALSAAGDPVRRRRQVLASTVLARYCEVLSTASGLVVSVCEFDSPAAAQAGLASSQARFDRLIPGRALEVRGKTLITLSPRPGAASAAPQTIRLFAALSPRTQGGSIP
jgi:hypothetical protein